MIAICISRKEANPGCSAAEPSHRPEKAFGHMAETVPASALTAWIVLFERNEGVKGKPRSGGEEPPLTPSLRSKKRALQAIKASLRPARRTTSWVRGPPPIPSPHARDRGALDRGPHMRVGKGERHSASKTRVKRAYGASRADAPHWCAWARRGAAQPRSHP